MKPALTDAEWASATKNMQAGFQALANLLQWAAHGMETSETRGRRHALAALALHGQPFGFTWDDVDALRHWATVLDRSTRVPQSGIDTLSAIVDARADHLHSIADRIAALLPPR